MCSFLSFIFFQLLNKLVDKIKPEMLIDMGYKIKYFYAIKFGLKKMEIDEKCKKLFHRKNLNVIFYY